MNCSVVSCCWQRIVVIVVVLVIILVLISLAVFNELSCCDGVCCCDDQTFVNKMWWNRIDWCLNDNLATPHFGGIRNGHLLWCIKFVIEIVLVEHDVISERRFVQLKK